MRCRCWAVAVGPSGVGGEEQRRAHPYVLVTRMFGCYGWSWMKSRSLYIDVGRWDVLRVHGFIKDDPLYTEAQQLLEPRYKQADDRKRMKCAIKVKQA